MKAYNTEYWRQRIAAAIASTPTFAGLDLNFVMKWVDEESAGQPCACSASGGRILMGHDGNPREIGLGQMYNSPDSSPDDFTRQGVSPSALRTYCGSLASFASAGSTTRDLTVAEEVQQVSNLLRLVAFGKARADEAIAANKLPPWPGADYWCLVKAMHALPGIIGLIPTVIQKAGRVPTSWGDYRGELESVLPSLGVKRGTDVFSAWQNGLNACEKTARAVGPVSGTTSVGGGVGGLGIIALLWAIVKALGL